MRSGKSISSEIFVKTAARVMTGNRAPIFAIVVTAAIAITGWCAMPVRASTITFDGGPDSPGTIHTGTTLDTAANWVDDTLPGPGDEALLDSSVFTLPSALTLTTSQSFGDLVINASTLSSIGLNGAAATSLTLNNTTSGSTAVIAAGGATGDLLLLGSNVVGSVTVSGTNEKLALGADRNVDVVNATSGLTVSAAISGNFNLTKTGAGALTLSGSNTFGSGKTFTLSAGTLNINSATAFGTSTFEIDGGVIDNTSGAKTLTNALVINSNLLLGGYLFNQTTMATSHDLTFSTGAVSLGTSSGIAREIIVDTTGNSGTTLTIGGIIAATTNGITKAGAGTLVLGGADLYTGTTSVGAGTLKITGSLNGTAGTNTGTALTLIGTSIVDFNEANGSSQNMGLLTFSAGDGTVQNIVGAGNAGTLTFADVAARTAGATANFVTSGGATNKIILSQFGGSAPATTTLLDRGIFFNGSAYATYDAGGFLRAYSASDTNAVTEATGTTTPIADGSTTNVFLTTQAVVAQTNANINTLDDTGAFNITITVNNVLGVNGILKGGGNSATIAMGTGTNSTGGMETTTSDAELVIRTDASGDSLSISAPILANGVNALTKTGAGTLTLGTVNKYSGPTTINGGTVSVSTIGNGGQASSALGTSSNAASNLIINGGTLSSTGSTSTDRLFTIGLGGAVIRGTTGSSAVNFTNTGALAFDGLGTHSLVLTAGGSGATNTFAPIIGDNGGATSLRTDQDTWILTGNNTFTGGVDINTGAIRVGMVAAGATAQPLGEGTIIYLGNLIGDTNATTLAYTGSGGILDKAFTVSSTTTGYCQIQNIGSGTLTLAGNLGISASNGLLGLQLVAANAPITVTGVISGGGVQASGANTVTLAGINTNTGATSVSNGRLLVNGSTAAGSAVSAISTGTLGGTGTINGSATVSAAGASINAGTTGVGTLTVGSLTMSNGKFVADVDDATNTTADTADKVIVSNGNVALGNGVATLALNFVSSNASYDSTIAFVLIDNTGAATTTTGYFNIDGTSGAPVGGLQTFNNGAGLAGTINYAYAADADSVGNDVAISFTSVPEPASLSLIVLGATGVLARRRTRK